MRAPKLLRPRQADETYVLFTEARDPRYPCVNADINLPVRDVVAALHMVMLDVQRRVRPTVTFHIDQHRYSYSITLRWQSSTGQIQLEGHADELGLTFRLTNAFGYSFEMSDQDKLARWNCTRNSWNDGNRGELNLYRLEKGHPYSRSTELSTTLDVFEGVKVRERCDRPRWHFEPARPDLIEDIVQVSQTYVAAI